MPKILILKIGSITPAITFDGNFIFSLLYVFCNVKTTEFLYLRVTYFCPLTQYTSLLNPTRNAGKHFSLTSFRQLKIAYNFLLIIACGIKGGLTETIYDIAINSVPPFNSQLAGTLIDFHKLIS